MSLTTEQLRDWLDVKLTAQDVKLDNICQDLADQKTQMALVEAAHRTLYTRMEKHELEPCQNVGRHYITEHKGLVLKIILWCITIIGGIIAIIEGIKALKYQ